MRYEDLILNRRKQRTETFAIRIEPTGVETGNSTYDVLIAQIHEYGGIPPEEVWALVAKAPEHWRLKALTRLAEEVKTRDAKQAFEQWRAMWTLPSPETAIKGGVSYALAHIFGAVERELGVYNLLEEKDWGIVDDVERKYERILEDFARSILPEVSSQYELWERIDQKAMELRPKFASDLTKAVANIAGSPQGFGPETYTWGEG